MRRQRRKSSVFAFKNDKKKVKRSSEAMQRTRRIPVSEISSGKSAASAKQTKKTKKKNPIFKKLRTAVLMCFFVCVVVGSGIFVGMYAAISREMKDMDVHNLSLNYSSMVYYTDELGNSYELEQLYDDGNRIWLEPDEIPDVVKDAVVAIEDERFYKHKGVDIKRTAGAVINWTIEKVTRGKRSYGGSTITQQLVKNITHEDKRTPIRKIKEMMRAIALERELSKDEIITLYLNVVFFANNCNGIEAASNLYFDKKTIDLTLPEAATIAGITQRPTYFNPIKNPENALNKRNVVLKKMKELGMIGEEEYNEASGSDLGLSKNHKERQSKIYSYFVDQVINDIISDLQNQKGYSEEFATQQVYNGGLKIYTTMNNDIQEKVESIFENESNFPSSSAAKKAQSAMIIIDPSNGEIKAMVGGKGKKTDSRGLNRATQTKRQPGSSFKPLSVYAPLIELKKLTAASILEDEKLTIGDWSPKNAYSGYKGNIPLRKAFEISSNTTAVRALQQLGVDSSYSFLKNKFHISTLADSDKSLSPLGLGGLTYGVTVKEMAAAYGVFANGGKYVKPHTYTKVIDNKGKLLLENNAAEENSISPETSFIITSLLTSVIKGKSGTGRLAKLDKMPAAGKTGTTNNDNDKWFVGYTPYYVGAVWYGFDQNASIRNAGVTTNISAKLWGMVMEKVHSDLPVKEFSVPPGVVEAKICTKSGKLANSGCTSSVEYFISGTEPTKHCTNHGSAAKKNETPSPSAKNETDDAESETNQSQSTHEPSEVTQKPSDSSSEDTVEIPDDVTVIPE